MVKPSDAIKGVVIEYRGLYDKYTVINNKTGKEVEGCFVLRPNKDSHAFWAVFEYASRCKEENPILSEQLFRWLDRIDKDERDY